MRNDDATVWRGEINISLKEQSQTMQQLLVEVRQRPTRPEIETMLATKVSLELFNAEQKSIQGDIADLRDDIADLRARPESFKSWLGTIGGIVGVSTGLLVLILQHWK